jgi:transposase
MTPRVVIEAEIRRVDCRSCGRVRTEWMPWARPGARHTRDFEDMAAWLAKRMSKAGVAMLMRTTWHTIDALVRRLVGEHLDSDRLDGIYRIGVDDSTPPVRQPPHAGSALFVPRWRHGE